MGRVQLRRQDWFEDRHGAGYAEEVEREEKQGEIVNVLVACS